MNLDRLLLAKANVADEASKPALSVNEIGLMAAVVVGIAAIWIAVHLYDRNRRKQDEARRAPREPFVDLCETHRLNSDEIGLLQRVAAEAGLAMPALAFVDPRPLHERVRRRDPDANAAAELGRKLFGDACEW